MTNDYAHMNLHRNFSEKRYIEENSTRLRMRRRHARWLYLRTEWWNERNLLRHRLQTNIEIIRRRGYLSDV